MLVLSRKKGETIVVGDEVTITIVEVRGDKVRLGIVAPENVKVYRDEIWIQINGKEHPHSELRRRTEG